MRPTLERSLSRDMANVTSCSNLVGRAGCPDMVVQQFGPLSEAAVLDLLYRCGHASPSNQCFPAMSKSIFDGISLSMPSLASWTAGCFHASELRGVVCAGDASCEGNIEAMILVDERWRRQGIGSVLLEETIDWARRGEANTLRFVCERTDWPMRHFARKFGARLDLVLGQIVVDIPLVF
jgi:GNAT superfamily N-acetyltransferase